MAGGKYHGMGLTEADSAVQGFNTQKVETHNLTKTLQPEGKTNQKERQKSKIH